MFKSNRIKQCREKKNLSQEGLMFALDKEGLRVSRQTIYSWEIGLTYPTVNDISILAKFFDMPIEYFFNKKNGRQPDESK